MLSIRGEKPKRSRGANSASVKKKRPKEAKPRPSLAKEQGTTREWKEIAKQYWC